MRGDSGTAEPGGGGREVIQEALLEMDRALWRLSWSWSSSLEEAEDLCQTMRLRVLERASTFKGRSTPHTWIYRVALNAGLDHGRARKRERFLPLEEDLPARDPARLEESLDLRSALARLPKRQRQIITLREVEGLTYKEIAEVLGIALGSVESGLFDARRKLAALLGVAGAKEGRP